MSISRVKAAGAIVAVILLLVTGNVAGNEPVSIDGRILTLSQCIDLGLKTNPAGAISLQGLKAAREKIEEGRSGYYPSFKLSSGYTYTTPQDSMPQVSEDSYDTRLALRQTLFDAGATANLLKGIRHGVSVQEHEVSKTELDIAYNIRLTFIDTLKKQALLEVEKKARESSERHLAQAQALHQAGVSSRADVIKSEVQLSNARLNVVRAENAVLSAKAALSAFMGVEVTVQFALDGREVDSLPQAGLPEVREVRAEAVQRRPELKGVQARLEAATAAISQAESGSYPQVSLDASYGWQENSFVPADKKWGVGVTVGIPIFEQLTTRSKVAQAEAGRNGLKGAALQARRLVELEVEQAWLGLKEAQDRLPVSRKAREQAEEDLRVSEGRYKEGLGTILEVIDAQTGLTSARTNSVVAAYDIANAQAKLDRATGKGK